MSDDPPRPKSVKTQRPDGQTISYDFHIDIEVRTPILDEKRLLQIIDDRIQRLASTLKNQTR